MDNIRQNLSFSFRNMVGMDKLAMGIVGKIG
jgi:hypothetical protein